MPGGSRTTGCGVAIGSAHSAMIQFDLIIVGLGNVARRFVELLDEQRNVLARDHDLETRVVATATRRNGCTYAGRSVAARSTLQFLRSALARSQGGARHGA